MNSRITPLDRVGESSLIDGPAHAQKAVVLIPAFQPEEILVDLVLSLRPMSFEAIIVIDDGSGPAGRALFDRLAILPQVHVLRHAVNLGKGAALKTGLNHALWRFPDCAGVVTADADGQHHPEDIGIVAEAMATRPGRLVLGVRRFEGVTPWRSRLGNTLTRLVFHALYGQKLIDTQTGLRGIPPGFIPTLLRIPSTGYEFELDMLVAARYSNTLLEQTPIRTIYRDGNRMSHFHPILDSLRIYAVLLRFFGISLLTTIVDGGLFMSVLTWSSVPLLAQCSGRLAALALNYRLNRRIVSFLAEHRERVWPRYLMGVCLGGAVSYCLLIALHQFLGFPIMAAKITAEAALFFVNFSLMRDFVFTSREPCSPARG